MRAKTRNFCCELLHPVCWTGPSGGIINDKGQFSRLYYAWSRGRLILSAILLHYWNADKIDDRDSDLRHDDWSILGRNVAFCSFPSRTRSSFLGSTNHHVWRLSLEPYCHAEHNHHSDTDWQRGRQRSRNRRHFHTYLFDNFSTFCVSGDNGLEWLFDKHGGIVILILHYHQHHHVGCVGLRVRVQNLQHRTAPFVQTSKCTTENKYIKS